MDLDNLNESEIMTQVKRDADKTDGDESRGPEIITGDVSSITAAAVNAELEISTSTKSNVGDLDGVVQSCQEVKEPSSKRVKLEKASKISLGEIHRDEEAVSSVKACIKEKEETLRRLKMVEMYKNKWSIEELKNQTRIWKELVQTTFEDLYNKSRTEKESLTKEELLKYLAVDPSMMDLSSESNSE